MAEKVLWFFYDSNSKSQSTALSTTDAQLAILKMTPQILDRLFIWTDGWKNWQQLKSYLQSEQKNFSSPYVSAVSTNGSDTTMTGVSGNDEETKSQIQHSPPPPENTASYSSIRLSEDTISRIINEDPGVGIHDFDGDEVTWSNVQKPDLDFSRFTKKSMGKRETRHELKIEILLLSKKNQSFRSHSQNISLSGVLLADTIPFDFYDTDFEAVVINTSTQDPRKSRVKLKAKVVGSTSGLTQRLMFQNPTESQLQDLKCLLEDYQKNKNKNTG